MSNVISFYSHSLFHDLDLYFLAEKHYEMRNMAEKNEIKKRLLHQEQESIKKANEQFKAFYLLKSLRG